MAWPSAVEQDYHTNLSTDVADRNWPESARNTQGQNELPQILLEIWKLNTEQNRQAEVLLRNSAAHDRLSQQSSQSTSKKLNLHK